MLVKYVKAINCRDSFGRLCLTGAGGVTDHYVFGFFSFDLQFIIKQGWKNEKTKSLVG